MFLRCCLIIIWLNVCGHLTIIPIYACGMSHAKVGPFKQPPLFWEGFSLDFGMWLLRISHHSAKITLVMSHTD